MSQTIKKLDVIKEIVKIIKEAELVYNLGKVQQPAILETILNQLNKA